MLKTLHTLLSLVVLNGVLSSCSLLFSPEEPNTNSSEEITEQMIEASQKLAADRELTVEQQSAEQIPASESLAGRKRGSLAEEKTTSVSVNQLQSDDNQELRIFWGIPEDEVDGFIVQYGYERESLIYQEEVLSAALEVQEHPEHGAIFVHILKEVKEGEDLYFRLIAFKGDSSSEPSETIKLSSADKKVLSSE